MPPVMNRRDSRARAEQAWRLRVRGRVWREVAEELGYRSARSAQKAVADFLERTPPPEIETLRRAAGEGLTMIRETLLDSLEAAHDRGDHRGVAQIGQTAADVIDKEAKLWGLHIAVPAQVDVTVHQSPAEVLAATRERLLAALQEPAAIEAQQPIEAEIIEEESEHA